MHTSGIEHGEFLVRLAAAVVGNENTLFDETSAPAEQETSAPAEQETLTEEGLRRLGNDGLVDAIAVASGFNAINMVADATGIPLDDHMDERSGDLREEIGVDAFRMSS